MTGSLRLAWLGHSTVVVDMDGTRAITDPLLGRHAGPLRRRFPQPRAAAYEGSEVVLLSHLHHDHCDLRSLRLMPTLPILTAPPNARWLRRRGLVGVDLDDTWQKVVGGSVEVRLTRADHRHRPMPHRPNAANGHLLRGRRLSVWAVGDTSFYSEMSQVEALVGTRLDVILVPIGGWGPRLSQGHMGPREAAVACAVSGARWALPVHWGTLYPPAMDRVGRGAWLDRPREEFVVALARGAPECHLIELRPGEEWVMPDGSRDDPGSTAGPAGPRGG